MDSVSSIVLVEALRNQYELMRRKSRGTAERLALTNAIVAMCKAPKTRLADDLQCVIYRRKEYDGLRLEVPDFALDKHTRRGRKLGRGVDHWWKEGIKLVPEAKGLNPYEKQAMELRKKYGGPRWPKDYFRRRPRPPGPELFEEAPR